MDKGRKGDGVAIERATGGMMTPDELVLFYRRWLPRPGRRDAEQARGRPPAVIVVHGAWEDSGLYDHVGEFLAHRGVQAWAPDLRGHGQSGGRRMYIERFQEYLSDLDLVVGAATADTDRRPILLGHSLGGLVCLRYAIDRQHRLEAVAVTSPWLGTRIQIPRPLLTAAPLLSGLAAAGPAREAAAGSPPGGRRCPGDEGRIGANRCHPPMGPRGAGRPAGSGRPHR